MTQAIMSYAQRDAVRNPRSRNPWIPADAILPHRGRTVSAMTGRGFVKAYHDGKFWRLHDGGDGVLDVLAWRWLK